VADLGALTPVGILAVLYAIGLTRDLDGAVDHGRRIAGWAGIALLALAVGPPVDVWAETNLTAHMVQHVVLLTIAPPLLVLGRVPESLVRSASPRVQQLLEPAGRGFRRAPLLAWTTLALAAQTAALGVWHVPVIYDAAATHAPLHAAEHLSFVLTGVAFWWLVARSGTGAAVIVIFLASLPGTLLGALLTLSTATWYPHYAGGSAGAALQDQQVAGVVMWAVAGMAYVAAGAVLFVMWLHELERRSPSRVVQVLR
jgi:cytochrome c oxidase assembly factor CtaG